MKKHVLPLLLALCLALTLLPIAALAEDIPDEAANLELSQNDNSNDNGGENADDAVLAVQALIDALPSAETVTADDYAAVEAAYDAYDALTDEQKSAVAGAQAFEALFDWFNSQTSNTDTSTAGTHSHIVCGNTTCSTHIESKTWTAVSDLSAIMTGGYYYLTQDVTLTSAWNPPSGGVFLCLNSHKIIGANGCDTIKIEGGHTLTLTDCQSTGQITHASDASGRGVNVYNGTFTMYGGSITGNRATANTDGCGGGVLVNNSFYMYGGSIANNSALSGGGVYVCEGRTFNMLGGEISGNNATNSQNGDGGGICSYSDKVTINGGSITGNSATCCGGGIYTKKALTLYNASITGNTAANYGGGVYTTKALTLTDASITGNTAGTAGGGVYANMGGDAVILSGTVTVTSNTQGSASAASNVYLPYSNTKIKLSSFSSSSSRIGVRASTSDTTTGRTIIDSGISSENKNCFTCDDSANYRMDAYLAYSKLNIVRTTAPEYGITLKKDNVVVDTVNLGTATVGYTGGTYQANVVVKNTGNQKTGALTITLSGNNAESFELSCNNISDISTGDTGWDHFTVKAKTGLAVGTHNATVTVTGNNDIEASLSVTFTVLSESGTSSTPGTPDAPTTPDTPDTPDNPSSPDIVPEGDYGYLYDVQRSPAYPSGANTSIYLFSLKMPYSGPGQQLPSSAGSWTLSKAGTYGQIKATAVNAPNLESVVATVAENYNIADNDTIIIHELKMNGEHLAYGAMLAYDAQKALFIGDTLSGGAGYLVSKTELSGAVDMLAAEVGVGTSSTPLPLPSTDPTPTTEPTPSTNPAPTTEPTPSTNPAPTTEPTPSTNPTPTTEPTPSTNPAPTTEPTPSTEVKPTPTTKPTTEPTAKPTAEPSAKPADKPAPSEKPESGNIPKTGDETNIALWLVLAAMGAMGLATVTKKKAK